MNANENMLQNFHCQQCDYTCSKRSCLEQHLSTAKHMKANSMLIPVQNYAAEKPKICEKYACDKCSVLFNHKSSLSRHKKTCKVVNITDHDFSIPKPLTSFFDTDLLIMLIKQMYKTILITPH